jgi:hypothetical protein
LKNPPTVRRWGAARVKSRSSAPSPYFETWGSPEWRTRPTTFSRKGVFSVLLAFFVSRILGIELLPEGDVHSRLVEALERRAPNSGCLRWNP